MKLNGRPISIYDNLDDFDYKSLYPSITSEFNMSKTTLVGHLTIPEKIYEFENRFHRDEIKWKREAQFMDDLQSHNWIEFFHRWFHFGSYEDVYDDVIEYFTKIKHPLGYIEFHDFDDVDKNEKPEEDNRTVFIPVSTDRDMSILDSVASRTYKEDLGHKEFDFDNSDFNCFTDIFEVLKDGYLYSKPKQIDKKEGDE